MLNIVALNGSLRGAAGNTARLLAYATRCVVGRAQVTPIGLADYAGSTASLVAQICQADALLLGSGVYWNNHGSPLQRFLEVVTGWETHDAFFGKPAAVVLTMDSVGGTEVAARLLGTLNLMGCTTPPLATVVISRVGMASAAEVDQEDVWSPADVQVLMDNLLVAAQVYKAGQAHWQRWGVKLTVQPEGRYAAPGALLVDQPPWLKA